MRKRRLTARSLRFWIWWAAGFATGLGCLLVLTLWMARSVYLLMPHHVTLGPEFQRVGAIVCLTGGRGRVRRAMELYDRGYGTYLYIAGVDPLVSKKELLRELGWVGPLEESHIELDHRSTNTIENAHEVAGFLKREKIKSILLITSIYHVRRAHYIFQKLLPRDVEIKVTWYERDPFDPDDWYKSGTGVWVTLSEFFKFFHAYLRLNFMN